MTNALNNRTAIRDQKWPTNGLEHLGACPACGDAMRTLLHERLFDNVFFAAPGEWAMWRCANCRSAFLDPRPNEATIGIAYGKYYTHSEIYGTALRSHGLRHRLGNDYRNWRFGTNMKPASVFGRYVAVLVPHIRRSIDSSYRYLPRLPPSRRKRLLDIGCGNGEFLSLATGAGWDGAGVEPDAAARVIAEARGFDVRDDVRLFADDKTFDAVTMSHVIEHLHDPLGTMRKIFDRMRRGASLYVATPNIDAVGHRLYGRHWRGLETPRHLMLFNQASLKRLLQDAGFRSIKFHAGPGALAFTADQSRMMAAGEDPNDPRSIGVGVWPTKNERRTADREGPSSEFLILTAVKP